MHHFPAAAVSSNYLRDFIISSWSHVMLSILRNTGVFVLIYLLFVLLDFCTVSVMEIVWEYSLRPHPLS